MSAAPSHSLATAYRVFRIGKPSTFRLVDGSVQEIAVQAASQREVEIESQGRRVHMPLGHFSLTTDRITPGNLAHCAEIGRLRITAEATGSLMNGSRYSASMVNLPSEQHVRLRVEDSESVPLLRGPHRFPLPGLDWNHADNWATPVPYGHHFGIDLNADRGHPIASVTDGTIVAIRSFDPTAQADDYWGNLLAVHGDDGIIYAYCHHQRLNPIIRLGARVAAGDILGWVGKSGFESMPFGPHLHFEMIFGRRPEAFRFDFASDDASLPTPNRILPHAVEGFAVNPYTYLSDWFREEPGAPASSRGHRSPR